MKLPIGVYVVSQAFANQTGEVHFRFKGTDYTAVMGENAFFRMEDVTRADLKPAEAPFCGYVGTPILLFPAGTYQAGILQPDCETDQRPCYYLPQAITVLGENAGVSPNASDLRTPNPLWGAESVFQGNQYFGAIGIRSVADGKFTVDGMVFHTSRVIDDREGGKDVSLTVKNCLFRDFCLYDLVVTETILDPAATRSTHLKNIRCDSISAMEGESRLVDLRSGSLTVENLYFANTDKFMGLTNFRRSFCCGRKGEKADISYTRCLFENCTAPTGFAVTLPEGNQITLSFDWCEFADATITAFLSGGNLKLKNTRLNGIVSVDGNIETQVLLEDCPGVVVEKRPPRRITVTKNIPLTDPHTPVQDDFSLLDNLYAGMEVYHGDAHAHTDSGGTSDGKTPLREFVSQLKGLNLDFAAIVDHRQMRHFFLPEWDETMLICGSEPSVLLAEKEGPFAYVHYNILFPDKEGLGNVLEAFPEFEYTGGTDGVFRYPRFSKARFEQLGEYIYSIGGLMAHAHPKQQMHCSDPMEYYFGDKVALETVHGDPGGYASAQNYALWLQLLDMGKRLRTYGSTDTHAHVRDDGQTTLYAKRRHSSDFLAAIRAGNCTAGAAGIQMAIDKTPMGGQTHYKDGQILRLRVGGYHKTWKKDALYRLNIYTDKGLAYAAEFLGDTETSVGLSVKKRAFYRAEIRNESDGYVAVLGNPIWLD